MRRGGLLHIVLYINAPYGIFYVLLRTVITTHLLLSPQKAMFKKVNKAFQ